MIKYLNRDPRGRWIRGTRWGAVAAGVSFAIILWAYIGHLYPQSAIQPAQAQSTTSMCVVVGTYTSTTLYNCSTPEMNQKWQDYLESEIDTLRADLGKPDSIFRRVCRTHDLLDADCPKILYGMAMTESRMKANTIGDGGKSKGYFQINRDYHAVPDSCAFDLECSADWTLTRMIRLGYATNWKTAVMKHNGTPGIPATVRYLNQVKKYAGI